MNLFITYSPAKSWHASTVPCDGCLMPLNQTALNGTWHDGTHIVGTIDPDDLGGNTSSTASSSTGQSSSSAISTTPPTSSSSVVPPQNTNTADSDGKGDDDDHDGDDGKKGKDDNKKRSGITRHSYVTFHLFFFLVLNNCTSSRQINVGQTRCESFHNYRARFR